MVIDLQRPWEAAHQGRELGELHRRILCLRPPDGLHGEGPSIRHGHLGRSLVILTERGPVVVGWSDAHRGTAQSDVSATLAIIAELRPPANARLRPLADRSWRRFDQAYRAAVGSIVDQ